MKTPSRSKPRIVDLPEAARVLKVDPIKLFKMVRSVEIPGAFQAGLAWRVDLDELLNFLETKPRKD